MTTTDADRYSAISTVFAAIDAVHNEDEDRVLALLKGMRLTDFIHASLGVNEIVVDALAIRLGVPFDVTLTDIRNQVLGREFGSDGDGAA